MVIQVCILMVDGGFATTALAPMEIFQSVGVTRGDGEWNIPPRRFRVTTASVDGQPVRVVGGVAVTPTKALNDVGRADLVIVPSLGINHDAAVNLAHRDELIGWLRERYEAGAAIAGICSGVSLLAEAGILDGRKATTHWAMADDVRARYPKVNWQPEYLVTEDHNVFCGGGINAGTDLALYLVEKYCGRALALNAAKVLLVQMPRIWQSGFEAVPLAAVHDDGKIVEAQSWLNDHWADPVRLEELATRLGMSPRNFIRRFKEATQQAPLVYLQKLRVAAAKRMLENKSDSVEAIARAVGYEDVPHFRNIFKRHTGDSPSAYRRQFGAH